MPIPKIKRQMTWQDASNYAEGLIKEIFNRIEAKYNEIEVPYSDSTRTLIAYSEKAGLFRAQLVATEVYTESLQRISSDLEEDDASK